jgi:hypothetical protein
MDALPLQRMEGLHHGQRRFCRGSTHKQRLTTDHSAGIATAAWAPTWPGVKAVKMG